MIAITSLGGRHTPLAADRDGVGPQAGAISPRRGWLPSACREASGIRISDGSNDARTVALKSLSPNLTITLVSSSWRCNTASDIHNENRSSVVAPRSMLPSAGTAVSHLLSGGALLSLENAPSAEGALGIGSNFPPPAATKTLKSKALPPLLSVSRILQFRDRSGFTFEKITSLGCSEREISSALPARPPPRFSRSPLQGAEEEAAAAAARVPDIVSCWASPSQGTLKQEKTGRWSDCFSDEYMSYLCASAGGLVTERNRILSVHAGTCFCERMSRASPPGLHL
mmetsp:Transcript_62072/g.117615  ORF Transcript_62072/g.117615 Transcript_62072/m.117615 type:complete len:284 (-) Transcript_62072:1302-2153(-)